MSKVFDGIKRGLEEALEYKFSAKKISNAEMHEIFDHTISEEAEKAVIEMAVEELKKEGKK